MQTERRCAGRLSLRRIKDRWGTITDRFVRTCGHIGVTTNTPDSGITMGPPAESEYAVEPVDVAITRPSALYSVKCVSSIKMSNRIRRERSPRVTTTSFNPSWEQMVLPFRLI